MNEEQQKISAHLFYEMPVRKTDVALLAGCRSVSGTTARLAAELYKKRAFGKIILTGGMPASSGTELAGVLGHHIQKRTLTKLFQAVTWSDFLNRQKEAEYMKTQLLENDVPEKDIVFFDNQARHSQDNVKNCKSILRDFRSATLITYAPFQRRLLGTARADEDLNAVDLQTVPVYPFAIDNTNWDSATIHRFVKMEFDKIDPRNPKSYIAKKFCVDPDIQQEIRRLSYAPLVI